MQPITIQGFVNEVGDVLIDPDDLVVAGDDDYEIGAAPRRSGGQNTRRIVDAARAASQQRSSKVRVKSGLLGLGTTSVAASATGSLDATAEEPLYLQRLLLDGDTVSFGLTDVKIGAKSIFSGIEAVPAGMFRPDATGAPFTFKQRMRVGQTVTASLKNNDAANAKVLSGAFKTIEQA